VDPEDYTFVVEPAQALDAGTWSMTILSISDDVGNTTATQEINLEIAGAPAPSTNPYVVWADAHDNIYDLRDGQYQISDVVHIQYSKTMSVDVLQSSVYTINGNPLPHGVTITWEQGVEYDANKFGDLVIIHLPFSFLGEDRAIFITNSSKFTAALYPHLDPYEPVDHHTIDINPSVKDTTDVSLTGNYNLVTTYDPDGLEQKHVIAYVNADSIPSNSVLESRDDIAPADLAAASAHVRDIAIMLPYFASTGLSQSADPDVSITNSDPEPLVITPPVDADGNLLPLGDVTVDAFNAPSVTIDVPEIKGNVDIDVAAAESVTIKADTINGTVDIDATAAESVTLDAKVTGAHAVSITVPEAKSVDIKGAVDDDVTIDATGATDAKITVEKNIGGDLTITSDGTEIRITGGVAGTLSINAANADVYVLKGTDTTGVIAAATITEIAGDTLTIGANVTIDALTVAATLVHAFTINYIGAIDNSLTIDGSGADITVKIQSNGTAAQEQTALDKFTALRNITSGSGATRLKFATATSL
jgi:hypothetical protein